jgi:phosphoserine phosphatase
MNNVLTLIAEDLGDQQVARARNFLPAVIEESWLNPGKACDLFFDGDLAEIAESARAMFEGQAVDFLVQRTKNRRKKLLLADMDSTIITIECIDELADLMGLKAEISAITEQAMRGEIEFADALRHRVRKLAGIHRRDVQRVVDERIILSEGARTMVQTMRAHGAFTALVSGGFTFFTKQVRVQTGFDVDRANSLDFRNDELSGDLIEPILDSSAKLKFLKDFQKQRQLSVDQTAAIGDGANDIPMLEAAGLGIAYHAKPATRVAAGAAIDHTDLTSVLYYQGYKVSEFVT